MEKFIYRVNNTTMYFSTDKTVRVDDDPKTGETHTVYDMPFAFVFTGVIKMDGNGITHAKSMQQKRVL
jgi:hypothetical protein